MMKHDEFIWHMSYIKNGIRVKRESRTIWSCCRKFLAHNNENISRDALMFLKVVTETLGAKFCQFFEVASMTLPQNTGHKKSKTKKKNRETSFPRIHVQHEHC